MIPPALSGAKSDSAPDLGGLGRVHPDQDLADLGLGQVLDDVGRIVGVHPRQERRGLLAAQRPEDRGGLMGIELLEELRDLLVGQPLEQDGDLARVEAGDEGGPLGRPDPFREAGDAVALALADQLLDLLEEGIGRHGRHGSAPGGWAGTARGRTIDDGHGRRDGPGARGMVAPTRSGTTPHQPERTALRHGPSFRLAYRSQWVGPPWSRGPHRPSLEPSVTVFRSVLAAPTIVRRPAVAGLALLIVLASAPAASARPAAPIDAPSVSGVPADAVAGTLEGIDVSHWQGPITWSLVAGAGKKFAILKATDGQVTSGVMYTDPTYATNHSQAKAAGLWTGAYHFARPGPEANDAKLEADHFAAVVNLGVGDLIPALDLEDSGGLSVAALQAWVTTFVGEVTLKVGVRPMIYTSPAFWKKYMGDSRALADAGYKTLWVAHWGVTSPAVPAANWGGRGWTFWQYTSDGSVPGIAGRVDLDRFNGTDLVDPGVRDVQARRVDPERISQAGRQLGGHRLDRADELHIRGRARRGGPARRRHGRLRRQPGSRHLGGPDGVGRRRPRRSGRIRSTITGQVSGSPGRRSSTSSSPTASRRPSPRPRPAWSRAGPSARRRSPPGSRGPRRTRAGSPRAPSSGASTAPRGGRRSGPRPARPRTASSRTAGRPASGCGQPTGRAT